MKKGRFSQTFVNRINLIIAVIALLISFPSAFNQLSEFLKDHFSVKKTKTIYYSPPSIYDINFDEGSEGFCWGSIASRRIDAARCTDDNSNIHDPCFLVSMFGDEDIYYYCPTLKNLESRGVLVKTSRDELNVSTTKEDDLGLPWQITFSNGSTCRMFTGTVEPAFGDKMIVYGCDKDMDVAENKVIGENYFFNCRYKGKKHYQECLAKTVVF